MHPHGGTTVAPAVATGTVAVVVGTSPPVARTGEGMTHPLVGTIATATRHLAVMTVTVSPHVVMTAMSVVVTVGMTVAATAMRLAVMIATGTGTGTGGVDPTLHVSSQGAP